MFTKSIMQKKDKKKKPRSDKTKGSTLNKQLTPPSPTHPPPKKKNNPNHNQTAVNHTCVSTK